MVGPAGYDVVDVNTGNVDCGVVSGPWGSEVSFGDEVADAPGVFGRVRGFVTTLGNDFGQVESVFVETDGKFLVVILDGVICSGEVFVISFGFFDEEQ